MPELDAGAASLAETVVAVTHLSRRFGAKVALQDVSMTVRRGSVFGLVGENGAGKSTLLKHLLGLWRAETLDGDRLLSLMLLLALMVVPLARVGLATSGLARNRHR